MVTQRKKGWVIYSFSESLSVVFSFLHYLVANNIIIIINWHHPFLIPFQDITVSPKIFDEIKEIEKEKGVTVVTGGIGGYKRPKVSVFPH